MNYIHATQHFETILDYLRFGVSQAQAEKIYCGHGTENATDDIYALILGSLSLPLDVDHFWLNARLTETEKKCLCEQLHQRIIDRIPVPYLIKEAYFCGLSFFVDERVLIPRSPIAELIEKQFSPWVDPDKVTQILDMCTGSGCIAMACAMAFPNASVDAADISADALAVAAINQSRLGLEDSVQLIQSDCFKNIPKKKYDLIVSNPPYVSHNEMKTLPKEYHHEPTLALAAVDNGLKIVVTLLDSAYDYLSEEGILVVEVGNTEEALIEAYPHVPFTWLEFERGGHGVFLLTKEQLADYFR